MLNDITLGQYFPGHSLVQRLDPRTKLLFTVAYIVALFLAKHVLGYAVLFVLLAVLIAAASCLPQRSANFCRSPYQRSEPS